jgi:translation initiation factor 3 subunit E
MAASNETVTTASPEYDLTHTLSPYLDVHLMFPILDFVKDLYNASDMRLAKLELLTKTNMCDYAIDIAMNVEEGEQYDEAAVPVELKEQRQAVVERMKELRAAVKPLRAIIDNAERVEELKEAGNFTREYLVAQDGVEDETIEQLCAYAKFQFDCGDYEKARTYLTHYLAVSVTAEQREQHGAAAAAADAEQQQQQRRGRQQDAAAAEVAPGDSPLIPYMTANGFAAGWGKFACEILLSNWDGALVDLNLLKDAIEKRPGVSPLEQLQQRTWLLHWSLFVFFNHPAGRDHIVDFFFQQRYLEAIQTQAPWLLRYLTAAVIINKRRRSVLKDLVKVIQQEANAYADPITQFLECLYVHFDFEAAQEKLKECETVVASDFFLLFSVAEFMELARRFIFETYCRIHRKIEIETLGEKLAMDAEKAERWIVSVIHAANLDAKIDSRENHIIMGNQYPTIYQQVIDKTKDLSSRSFALANNLERQIRDRTFERAREVDRLRQMRDY